MKPVSAVFMFDDNSAVAFRFERGKVISANVSVDMKETEFDNDRHQFTACATHAKELIGKVRGDADRERLRGVPKMDVRPKASVSNHRGGPRRTATEGNLMASISKIERPIPVSGPMVNAIRNNRKTVTRRIIKIQPDNPGVFGTSPIWGSGIPALDTPGVVRGTIPRSCVGKYSIHAATNVDGARVDQWIPCPYGKPGDRLWVKEALRGVIDTTVNRHEQMPIVAYEADGAHIWSKGGPRVHWNWKRSKLPSIYMPRALCRELLEVIEIRAERLHDITEEQAVAEGFTTLTYRDGRGVESARLGFQRLWIVLNGEESWLANPWVWVITFKRIEVAA